PSAAPILRTSSALPLKAKEEVRAATVSAGTWASMSSSVSERPSEKYSLSLSALMLTKGSTAIDAVPACAGALGAAAAGAGAGAFRRGAAHEVPEQARRSRDAADRQDQEAQPQPARGLRGRLFAAEHPGRADGYREPGRERGDHVAEHRLGPMQPVHDRLDD